MKPPPIIPGPPNSPIRIRPKTIADLKEIAQRFDLEERNKGFFSYKKYQLWKKYNSFCSWYVCKKLDIAARLNPKKYKWYYDEGFDK